MCNIHLSSLTQDDFSPLNCDEGRKSMETVGIFTTHSIGNWIHEALSSHLQQKELASNLATFFKN